MTNELTLGRHTWTLDVSPGNVRVLVNGFQSWSDAELRPLTDVQAGPQLAWLREQGYDPAFPRSDTAGVWRSHTLIALVRPDGGGWVGCALDETRGFTTWEARADGDRVSLTASVEGPEMPVAFEETEDVIATVEALAERLGAAMNARRPPPLRVWCSWYSYYSRVTLEAMLENARLAREHNLPFDVFQLDDGFQAGLGDWFAESAHFGGHAKELPARLGELGFRAGLWLAPFLAGPGSGLFRDHPEWMLRGADGRPLPIGHNWGGPYYALDTTREDVLEWLRNLGRTVRGWGYDYLKLDFLYGAALPGVRARPELTRAEAYRQGLRALREGAGEDAFLLACGAPLAASVGLVDAMRIGPDVTPFWDDESRRVWLRDGSAPSARNAIHTSLARWYQHLWYQPDPDVMIARREQSLLNDDERHALLGLLDVIGGLRASSDPIEMLDARGLDLLREALRLSEPDRPRTLTESLGGTPTHFVRGTFNLLDVPAAGPPPHAYVDNVGGVRDGSIIAP